MPEVSNEDAELAKLARKVLGSKHKTAFQRQIKEVAPELHIHDLEVEDRIASATKSSTDEVLKLREEIERRNALDGLKERRAAIKAKHGLDDSGVQQVEKIMVDRKIGDHDTAAEFFKLNQRTASPMPHSMKSTKIEIPMAEALAKDPVGWAREEAARVVNELHGVK